MRLLSIEAKDFLSFGDLHLDRLDGRLGVVVGPNGVGKSNLRRVLEVAILALGWADFDQVALGKLADYETAVRRGSESETFSLRVGVECTEEWEKDLWLSLVRAVVISNLLDPSSAVGANPYQDSASQLRLDASVLAITQQDVSCLFRGRVAVSFQGGLSPNWSVGYEFDHGDQSFCYVLHGASRSGQIVAGSLPLPATASSSQPLDRRLRDAVDTDATGLSFSFERLLPSADEGVPMETKPVRTAVPLPSLVAFASAVDARELERRSYAGAVVLRGIISRSLTLVSDQRGVARFHYEPWELEARLSLTDASAVPLELFLLKEGDFTSRALYQEVRKLFRDLTGQEFDLQTQAIRPPGTVTTAQVPPHVGDASVVGRPAGSATEDVVMRIQPQVLGEDCREVPIQFAGAGLWETLVVSTALAGPSGRVVVLDEPAVNLHPTLERRLLRYLLDEPQRQVILVTHSPYLVPARSTQDLHRIVRLTRTRLGTQVHRLCDQGTSDATGATRVSEDRWRQILATSTEARAALFARSVVLVEGDTELGLFDRWFPATQIALTDRSLAPDALNLLVLPVGGDGAFGSYVSLLDALDIPWAIVCDGPVLSPQYKAGTPLIEQLLTAAVSASGAVPPADPADFQAWKAHWAGRRVFTLADRFGGLKDNDKDKSGEVEAFLATVDARRWAAAKAVHPKSKVRAAHHFAETIPCPPQVDDLYRHILTALRLLVPQIPARATI